MKFRVPALAIMMVLSTFCFAKPKHAPIVGVTPRPKKQFVIGAIASSAACGLAIGLSANPATAAEIGVPILVGGNYLAYRLYQNHPRWSAVVQTLSPLGCALGGLHKPTKPPVKLSDPHTPINSPGSNPPTSGSGNPSGNPGGSPGGSGGSTGSGSGSGGSNSGGGSTGGSGGSTGGGNPPPAPCTVHGGTDCGFGNGGFNGGSNPKPPTTPPGDPHTHGKL